MTTQTRFTRIARALVAAAAAVAVAAVATGCGDSHKKTTLTKAQVIAQGTKICKAAEHKVEAMPQPSDEHPFGPGTSQGEHKQAREWLTGYANALEGSVDGLAKLAAPDNGRQLLDGYIRDTRAVVDKLRDASRAPNAKVESEVNEAFGMFDEASKQTAAYGFPKGVCGSGSSS
jgi:hypothetical protein